MSFFKRIAALLAPKPTTPARVVQVDVKQHVRAGGKVKKHQRRVVKAAPKGAPPGAVQAPTPKPVVKKAKPHADPELKEWGRAYQFRIWLAEQQGKPYSGRKTYMRRQYAATLGRCTWNGHGAAANTICAEEHPYGFPGDRDRNAEWVYWFFCPACADVWEASNIKFGWRRKK